MAYRIRKHETNSKINDDLIRRIEGVYETLEHALKKADTLRRSYLEDGTIWLYDENVTKEEIAADADGHRAVAIIELVQ